MPFEIVKPDTHIDFIGKWRIAAVVSLVVILAGAIAIPLRGFRLGIDFAGGTEVQVRFDEAAVDEGDVRGVVEGLGIEGASVIRYGETEVSEFLVKFPGARAIEAPAEGAAAAPATDAEEAEAASEGSDEAGEAAVATLAAPDAEGAVNARTDRILALQDALEREIGSLHVERVEFVGPKVGAELREDGLRAMAFAGIVILLYIAFRFSTRFAPGAIVALVHDVLVTSGVWVLLGLEFDLRVLAALLAIIGYSLNDTIIVYDRIRENLELHTRHDLVDVLNRSVNQTLSRTLLTSATTLAAVGALLLLGGSVVRPFALAMGIGIIVGTYSSVFVAAPTLLWLESRSSKGASGTGGTGKEPAPKPARSAAAAAKPARPQPARSGGKSKPKGKAKGKRGRN